MDYTMIKKMPNSEAMELAVTKNDGYCPWKSIKNEHTKCMCLEFRNQPNGECSCGLYFKTDADFVLYTREGCPRCDILKKELARVGKTYIESTDYPDGMETLPMMVAASGAEYDFKAAMALFPRRRTL